MKINNEERKIILEFLQWNDHNGCYTDNNCKGKEIKPLGKKDTLKIFFAVVNNDFFKDKDDDNPLNFTLLEIIKISKRSNVYFSTTLKLTMLLRNNNIETYKKLIKMIG
ncbi:hypothetical protein [Clostridium hydrogeniformans]|uniref:hypothetical protein n=1 Tax=Clostridium hydrogeniformans TaxID=349933 RepID=UPI00054E65A6|nr:hypothetical protein [Clostridium hydrogeniformans]